MDFVYEVMPEDHQILRTRMENFDFNNPPIDPIILEQQLFYVMEKENAVGLSSNQIGLPYRAFVMSVNGNARGCFNPEIISNSSDIVLDIEGCVSFPQLWLNVKRPFSVEVRYQNKNGIFVNETFDNLEARVYSHETDHLNGIRFIDLVGPLALTSAKAKRKKKLKRN